MFSISALCLTPHWNMPVSVTAYDRAKPTDPGSISETEKKTNFVIRPECVSAKEARRSSTVPEVEAAECGDGDKNGANSIEPHGEPARRGQEQEPGLCLEAQKKREKERIKNLCGKAVIENV